MAMATTRRVHTATVCHSVGDGGGGGPRGALDGVGGCRKGGRKVASDRKGTRVGGVQPPLRWHSPARPSVPIAGSKRGSLEKLRDEQGKERDGVGRSDAVAGERIARCIHSSPNAGCHATRRRANTSDSVHTGLWVQDVTKVWPFWLGG